MNIIKKNIDKKEKEKTMNIEKIKDHIKYLREDKYNTEFYVALLAYDIFEFDEKEITEEIINKIFEIEDRYDSIYNEELRDELRREIEENQEIELEEKIEKMEEFYDR